ncbi:MAG: hypothetical protein Q9M94_05405 [Candidatus Gracilibacteria bacterium]|nr:hypothetical protein [Candidatus Gracilibacteria bacterium]
MEFCLITDSKRELLNSIGELSNTTTSSSIKEQIKNIGIYFSPSQNFS